MLRNCLDNLQDAFCFRWCRGLSTTLQGTETKPLLGRNGDVTGPGTRYKSLQDAHKVLKREYTEGRRVLIIGDVHGCADELTDLLQKVNFSKGKDIAVFVGDLIAKGPNSKEVLRIVRSIDAHAVRGNHDHYAIMRLSDDLFPEKEHSKLARELLSRDDMTWLAGCPLSLTIEQYNTVVVHAGILPGLSLEENSLQDMLHMRNIVGESESDMKGTSDPKIGTPWVSRWCGPQHVIFGHDAVRKIQEGDFSTGLDSGCVYGGSLSGLLLPQHEIISVPARKVYVVPGKKGE